MDYESNDKLFSLKKSNSFNLSATEKTLLLSRLCRIYTSRHCLRNHCHAMSKGFNSFVAILTVKPPSGRSGFERQENGVSGFRADDEKSRLIFNEEGGQPILVIASGYLSIAVQFLKNNCVIAFSQTFDISRVSL